MDIKGIRTQQFNNDIEKLRRKNADGAKFKKELDSTKTNNSSNILKDEEVKLSPESKEIREAKEIVDRASDVRWDKVEEIKAKIASGNYKIDAEAIAEKFISTGFYKNLL
ncbi:MAG: flagellar biosynthesis anti-sigma factor FlgM [Candidatus Muirbacterium halophilum]|nr:flagellar biosynthesis anti-sigma factor FlgM [Candidatus Muirbacterium halophilum]MCK9474767.1 flagellar biosynthesis anti-sigma factor FlgM [Candidatus Muirbacterium halophilum]